MRLALPLVLPLVLLSTLLIGLFSCGSKTAKSPADENTSAHLGGNRGDAGAPKDAPTIQPHLISMAGEKTLGPFLARRGSSILVAYIAPPERGVRKVVGLPLNVHGELSS